jgi:hypothetical protein
MPLRRPIPESLPLSNVAEPNHEAIAALHSPSEKNRAGALSFQISAPGTVSVYGLGHSPVTLESEQWQQLLAHAEELRSFLEENRSRLPAPESLASRKPEGE